MSSKAIIVIFAFAVVVTFTYTAKAQKIVIDGLVSYWTLDKDTISGGLVKDIIGGNHGEINGKPKTVEGKVREALEFDGAADFLDCGTDESLNLTDALTIETWVKPKDFGEGGAKNAGPVCKAQSGAWGWQLRYNAPGGNFMGFQFDADPGGSTWIDVGEKLNPGEWYHIAGTFDGKEIKCYLNGVEKSKGQIAGILSTPDTFFIGQDGWVNVFNGAIDEVKMYKRALSKDEVMQNYTAKSQLAVESESKLAISWGKIKVEN